MVPPGHISLRARRVIFLQVEIAFIFLIREHPANRSGLPLAVRHGFDTEIIQQIR